MSRSTSIYCLLIGTLWKIAAPPQTLPIYSIALHFKPAGSSHPDKVVSPPTLTKPARFRKILTRKKRKLNARLRAIKIHHPSSSGITKLRDNLAIIQLKIKDSIFAQLQFKEAKVIQSINDNPRVFFSYAKQKSKVKSLIGPLLDPDGNFHTSPKSMADLLQSQYSTVFSDPEDVPSQFPIFGASHGLHILPCRHRSSYWWNWWKLLLWWEQHTC